MRRTTLAVPAFVLIGWGYLGSAGETVQGLSFEAMPEGRGCLLLSRPSRRCSAVEPLPHPRYTPAVHSLQRKGEP